MSGCVADGRIEGDKRNIPIPDGGPFSLLGGAPIARGACGTPDYSHVGESKEPRIPLPNPGERVRYFCVSCGGVSVNLTAAEAASERRRGHEIHVWRDPSDIVRMILALFIPWALLAAAVGL